MGLFTDRSTEDKAARSSPDKTPLQTHAFRIQDYAFNRMKDKVTVYNNLYQYIFESNFQAQDILDSIGKNAPDLLMHMQDLQDQVNLLRPDLLNPDYEIPEYTVNNDETVTLD